MRLWKRISKKLKKPTEWIEVGIPKTISKVTKKMKGSKEEE